MGHYLPDKNLIAAKIAGVQVELENLQEVGMPALGGTI